MFSKDWKISVKWIRGYFRQSKYNPKRSFRAIILHVWLIQDICKVFWLLCFLKVPWVTISNKSSRSKECHVIYSMTTKSKISVTFSPQNNTCIISSLNTSRVFKLFIPSLHLPNSVLKKSFQLFTICNSSRQDFPLFEQGCSVLKSLDGS